MRLIHKIDQPKVFVTGRGLVASTAPILVSGRAKPIAGWISKKNVSTPKIDISESGSGLSAKSRKVLKYLAGSGFRII